MRVFFYEQLKPANQQGQSISGFQVVIFICE